MTNKEIYKKAAKKGGWIFSPSKQCVYECKWEDLYEYVIKNYKLEGKVILDIGSAEGTKFSKLAPYITFGVGIDTEVEMVELACKNCKKNGVTNMHFVTMTSKRLIFPDNFFDMVTCRHAPFDLKEIHRVLKKGGVFVTQQVHERDKQNLKECFGRGQNYKIESDKTAEAMVKKAKQLKFKNVGHLRSDLPYYFNSEKHLVNFLEQTPVIPNYNHKKEGPLLKDFITQNKTQKGIKSNSVRYLISVKK